VVKVTSPLARQGSGEEVSGEDNTVTVPTDEDRSDGVRLSFKAQDKKAMEKDKEEKSRDNSENKGLGLSLKDSFSSSTLGSGSLVPGPVTPMRRGVIATSPTLRTSPSPRIYTSTPTFAATTDKDQQAADTADKTPKRDSLSPTTTLPRVTFSHISPTSIPIIASTSVPPTTISVPRTILSRIPHHLTPPSHTTILFPPSPKQTHPYTSNTQITPSCTYGALTHRLKCGHLVLTLKSEVCGRNCVLHTREQDEGGGENEDEDEDVENGADGEGKAEQGFVANLRSVHDAWVCPCCGIGEDKGVKKGRRGKRCVSVLDVDVGGCS
jgi:hypothetical protein